MSQSVNVVDFLLLVQFLMDPEYERQYRQACLRNRVTYVVESRWLVTLPSARHCGYNEYRLPNVGIFLRERRKYTHYRHGKPWRVWFQVVDRFIRRHSCQAA